MPRLRRLESLLDIETASEKPLSCRGPHLEQHRCCCVKLVPEAVCRSRSWGGVLDSRALQRLG